MCPGTAFPRTISCETFGSRESTEKAPLESTRYGRRLLTAEYAVPTSAKLDERSTWTKPPRFFGSRTLPKYVAAHTSASSAGQHRMQLPQLLQLQVCSLSNLDLGQTATRPATQEPVQPGCPLIDDGAPDAGDVASDEPQDCVEWDKEPGSHLVFVKSEPDYYEEYREPDSPVPPLAKEYTDVTRVTFHLGTGL
ncbi:unnamed protein product [Ixodes pacificus]